MFVSEYVHRPLNVSRVPGECMIPLKMLFITKCVCERMVRACGHIALAAHVRGAEDR